MPEADLSHIVFKDRPHLLLPVYDGDGNWRMFQKVESGIIQIQPEDLVDSPYLAKEPAYESDLYIEFVDFLYQKSTIGAFVAFYGAAIDDICSLATALKKIDLIRLCEIENKSKSDCIATEIEYMLYLCRSIFDLFQRIAKKQWDKIELHDKRAHKKPLPDSFRRMVFSDNELRSAEEIKSIWGIPIEWAQMYLESAEFLKKLRYARNKIDHDGQLKPTIFLAGNIAHVSTKAFPFVEFPAWREDEIDEREIGELLPFLEYIISNTIKSMNLLIDGMRSKIEFPGDQSPEYRVYIRSAHIEELSKLKLVFEQIEPVDANPWSQRSDSNR